MTLEPSRLSRLASEAPTGLGLANDDGHLLWVNAYLGELLGLPPGDQDQPVRLLDHLTPASRIFFQARLNQELARGGRIEEMALDVRRPGGTRIPVMLSATRVERLGEPGATQMVVSRAPVRRAYEAEVPKAIQRADAERDAARAIIATFVSHCPVPLIMTDLDLVVTGVSGAWEDVYGMPAQDVLGTRIDRPREGRQASGMDWGPVYARALNGESLASRTPVKSTYGDLWFNWTVIPWRDATGEVAGLLLMNFDVTALIQARDAAAAADAAKSRFLANLSHELRTPLNSVLAPLELFARETMTPSAVEQLDGVRRAGAELARNLTTLLDYSQLEAGGFTNDLAPFNIARLCGDVLRECADLAVDRPIRLVEPSLDPGLTGLGDCDAIRRILVQLVSNGIKFTQAGEVAIEVEHDGEDLILSVRDTGMGFDILDFPTLVKPFHQRDVSTTRAHGGMGLGLALTQTLARSIGGRLTAESAPGRGSRMSLHVPMVVTHEVGPADQVADGDGETLRVLAVDDNPANLVVLESILRAVGAEVTLAVNGQDAVSAAETARFDVILMDVQMPVMDGLTATRIIRAARATPIIVVSANVSRPEVAAARQAGADEVLGKPISPATLLTAIDCVLEMRSEPALACA